MKQVKRAQPPDKHPSPDRFWPSCPPGQQSGVQALREAPVGHRGAARGALAQAAWKRKQLFSLATQMLLAGRGTPEGSCRTVSSPKEEKAWGPGGGSAPSPAFFLGSYLTFPPSSSFLPFGAGVVVVQTNNGPSRDCLRDAAPLSPSGAASSVRRPVACKSIHPFCVHRGWCKTSSTRAQRRRSSGAWGLMGRSPW